MSRWGALVPGREHLGLDANENANAICPALGGVPLATESGQEVDDPIERSVAGDEQYVLRAKEIVPYHALHPLVPEVVGKTFCRGPRCARLVENELGLALVGNLSRHSSDFSRWGGSRRPEALHGSR